MVALKNNIMKKIKMLLTWKALILFVFIILFGATIAFGYYFYAKYQKVLKNPDIITKQEVDWLQDKVGKLMQLPNEAPSTATVLDKDKLKDQPFFQNAENGDKILVYAEAQKAILYRPSTNRVIEVMPISLDNSQNASIGATTATIKIALLNGTNIDGLTNAAEINIKNKIANVEIVSKEKAKKTDYTNTIVIDVLGDKAEQTKTIAGAVGGVVGPMPTGETKPNADILVIVAK